MRLHGIAGLLFGCLRECWMNEELECEMEVCNGHNLSWGEVRKERITETERNPQAVIGARSCNDNDLMLYISDSDTQLVPALLDCNVLRCSSRWAFVRLSLNRQLVSATCGGIDTRRLLCTLQRSIIRVSNHFLSSVFI